MSQHDERRRFTRVNFDAKATLTQGDTTLDIHVLDISVNGVLVETPEEYSISTEESVKIHLALADDAKIVMMANLVHSSSDLLGFKCISIDMESATQLRRLIELNMEEDNATERVLDELLARASEA